jgi:hypothetical protein
MIPQSRLTTGVKPSNTTMTEKGLELGKKKSYVLKKNFEIAFDP